MSRASPAEFFSTKRMFLTVMASNKTPVFAADGLIQLHYQNREEPDKSEMVAQGGDFTSAEEMLDWIREMSDKYGKDCPEECQLMICDSTSVHFLWAAKQVTL